MKYGNRSAYRRIISSPITLVIALVLFFLLAKAVWNVHLKAVASNARLDETRAELAKLQARQADLSRKVQYLSTTEGVDAEIRTKYRAVKEGESVAVILDNTDGTGGTAAAADASSTAPTRGFWARIFHVFGL